MTWVRIDEHFDEHPKIESVGPLATAVYIAGLCYSNRQLTNGFIPRRKALRLVDVSDYSDPETEIKKLCATGLWVVEADGYRIHDYHDYQPSKQQVIEQRAKKQAAGAAGGRASAKAFAAANRPAEINPVPVPVSGSVSKPEPKEKTAPTRASDAVYASSAESKVAVPARSADQSVEVPQDSDFEQFWDRFPARHGKRVGKGPAQTVWRRLSKVKRSLALSAVEHYRSACDGGVTLAKDPHRWLSSSSWVDWQTPAEAPRNGSKPFANASAEEYERAEI